MSTVVLIDCKELTSRVRLQLNHLKHLGLIFEWEYAAHQLKITAFNAQAVVDVGMTIGRFPEVHKLHPDLFDPPLK